MLQLKGNGSVQRRTPGVVLRALALSVFFAFLSCSSAGMEGAEITYTENSWNFVEESMDISGGIPEYATGVLARVQDKGVLRVATEPYFPPQEFLDETKSGQDQFVGSDMEMARLIAERMGVELQLIPLDFSEVLPALAEGTADLAISALSYTPGRASSYELSKGYHFASEGAGAGLVIRAEDADALMTQAAQLLAASAEDEYTLQQALLDCFASRTLIAQSGSLQEALLAEKAAGYLEYRRVSAIQSVYDAVASGDADAGAVDLESAQVYLAAHPESGLAILPGVQFQLSAEMDGDRVAAKNGETMIIAFVNGVIDELLESGRYEAWYLAYSSYGGDK